MDVRDKLFGELLEIMTFDSNVIILTADMGAMGLDIIRKALPEQFINMGVSEQNMISVAAGLALGGRKVFCYAIAAFLVYRAYDQIRVDIDGMNLPVVLLGMGGGKHYLADGFTHHAETDIALMSVLTNMIILTPDRLGDAYKSSNPVYISISRGEVDRRRGKITQLLWQNSWYYHENKLPLKCADVEIQKHYYWLTTKVLNEEK